MEILRNKKLYVLDENSATYSPLYTVKDEVFLTADITNSEVFYGSGTYYNNAITSPINIRVIRVYILNKDETLRQDISEYVSNWSLSFEYKQGAIRSGNLELINIDNMWLPNPVNNSVWKGTKFKIHIGIYHDEVVYWKDCGVVIGGNISVDTANGTVSLPLYDKFSTLDGTIGGKRNYAFVIPIGTHIKQAIELCLSELKSDLSNEVFDFKPIIFPLGITIWDGVEVPYSEISTPYTIKKDPDCTIGEIIIELADMLSLDVYYNNDGNLTLSPGAVTNEDFLNRPIQWLYEDGKGQYSPPSYDIDFDNLITEIIVAGAIENGAQYKAKIVNPPKSQANPQLTEPNPAYLEDNNLIGNEACESRAKYEMLKNGRLGIQLKFDSIFIPHLESNQVVVFNNVELGIINELFVINSLSISSEMLMSLSLSSVREVSF